MNDDFKNKVAGIIENDVIKYLELEIRPGSKPEVKQILEQFTQKEINVQEVLQKLNGLEEFELARKLYNMINVHQKNYHHIISFIGTSFL